MQAQLASRAAVVALLDKGHLCDGEALRLAAHLGEELGARLVAARRHVAHADALFEAGREAARSDDANLGARLVPQRRPLADRRPLVDDEAAPRARARLVPKLGQDAIRAAEGAVLGAPPLGNHPRERPLHGRRRVVQVVAVQAEAGLEAEGVARAEPDRGHVLPLEQRAPEPAHGVLRPPARRHRNLKPVLARVPGAGHEALLARHLHRPRAHEGHLGEVDRRERLQHLRRRGALQRQDAVVG
mmetsp:Transcript_27159/g.90285  ORF Transcript_27159/g.90285 Transcript_27159/m.90285 type:complete len:244 (-) Transcript_27159:573-1304(-)